jgi:ubiquinone/menaquinone biosynthesis C-methylase UbiE
MLKDRIARFLWRQFRKPSGVFGRIIGNRMAEGNVYDARWTVSLLDIQPEHHVLEIGFGPGVSTHYAAEKATKGFVAGIDHSETMVQAARQRNIETIQAGRMDLKQGDVASLPYLDETFDRAFSIHSIYFWAKPIECLRELRRVLKPGGLLAITIQPKDKWDELQQRESSLRTLYFSPDLVPMFDAAGFRGVRVEICPEPDQFPGECVLGLK